MKPAQLTQRFYELIAPDIPNEWDVEEVLEPLLDERDEVCQAALSHIPVIWPVSHSLCFDFLRLLPETLRQLSLEQIPRWISISLDHYETNGLKAAQRFMTDGIEDYLAQLDGSGGLSFESIEKRLLPYIRGIAREELQIASSRQIYTDTSTLFLPKELSFSAENSDNFLYYKFSLTFQWGFIHCGSFTVKTEHTDSPPESGTLPLQHCLDGHEVPALARDIYHCLESIRVRTFLEKEFPGLMRAARKQIFPFLTRLDGSHPLHCLLNAVTADRKETAAGVSPLLSEEEAAAYAQGKATAADSLALTTRLHQRLAADIADYIPLQPFSFQGIFKLKAVAAARSRKEQKMGEQFADMMASHLLSLSQEKLRDIFQEDEKRNADGSLAESDVTMIMDSEFARTADQEKAAPVLITINNEELQLPEELADFSKSFFDEFGQTPARFLSAAAGKAGQQMLETAPLNDAEEHSDHAAASAIFYDEWDHRREGFRKNWCSLYCKDLLPVHSSFIRNTLDKYHGLSLRLRHQFEMLRSQERFVRRQREGDDIDFDALIESISDSCAGISSSDRLFIRLKRDSRDIAVLFLVDMSNSTAGWVNNALKESLVLMAEAMEVLGDRYAIYGFSGMRRSRCEFFHVKHLSEPYGDAVRERIGSIAPGEYTRMGPAIRHATRILTDVDARVRLLITLSDGKPEDYDAYKGDYAIEDTRHALLEAKTADIHPFCITIDHHAKDYMKHMYGPANYIFINDVRKLPLRMPEIYRTLTT